MSIDSSSKLSISSHVVVQLGRELVTDNEQAILELVKNAYDADSPTCSISIDPNWKVKPDNEDLYFSLFPELKIEKNDNAEEKKKKKQQTLPREVGRILVQDFGEGISPEDVKSGWLRISASKKRAKEGEVKTKTKLGRTPVGDKGLGRLATMKLGKVIQLHTTRKNEKVERSVWFSWDDFTEDRTLDDVPVYSLDPKNKTNQNEQGSTIEIIGLHDNDSWNSIDRVSKGLNQKLADLVSPFLEESGFDISINHKGHTYNIAVLDEDVLNLSASSWSWEWDNENLIHNAQINQLFFFGTGTGDTKKKYELVFEKREMREKFLESVLNDKKFKNYNVKKTKSPGLISASYSERIGSAIPIDKSYPGAENPGPFKAHIYDFNLSQKSKESISASGVSVERIKNSGVLIFRDGFRIRADKDWINFAESQTSGGSFYGFRPGNIIGFTLISNQYNPKLIEKSDRESFVDNPAFRGFMLLISRLKKQDNDFRELLRRHFVDFVTKNSVSDDSVPSSEKYLLDLQENSIQVSRNFSEVMKEISLLESEIENENIDITKAKNLAARVNKKAQILANKNKVDLQKLKYLTLQNSNDKDKYLRLIDAAAVGLTARSISHELHTYSRQFKQGIGGIHKENLILKNSQIEKQIRNLKSTERELSKMISALDPLLPGTRSIKEKINLEKFLTNYVESRKSRASSKGVEFSLVIKAGDEFFVRFSQSRLLQVFENLFQNSMYWLTYAKNLNLPKPKKILIELNGFEVYWSDNGPGVNQLYEETLFDPYISDKPVSEGQGLGLHISSVFLASENCSIQLSEDRNILKRRYKFKIDLSGAKFVSKQGRIL